jgi:hypothetical protein
LMRGLPANREGELVLAAILFEMIHGREPTLQSLGPLTGLGDAAGSKLEELAAADAIVIDVEVTMQPRTKVACVMPPKNGSRWAKRVAEG